MGDSQHVSEQSLTASLSGVETTPLALDLLYNEVDKLYHAYARGCGLSDCAYWMLYDIERAGGELPLARLTESWSYSKQTINSALKVLQERGLMRWRSWKAAARVNWRPSPKRGARFLPSASFLPFARRSVRFRR